MSEATHPDGTPTVVLVHGAFADASSWSGVIARLQAEGVPGRCTGEPPAWNRGRLRVHRSVLEQIEGPVVAVSTRTAAR
jgi:hypothetical protein